MSLMKNWKQATKEDVGAHEGTENGTCKEARESQNRNPKGRKRDRKNLEGYRAGTLEPGWRINREHRE